MFCVGICAALPAERIDGISFCRTERNEKCILCDRGISYDHIVDEYCGRILYMKEISSQNKQISVIVPIYNVKPYLEKCMESIIGQTYHNLQIILVDDGSTDGSGKLCDIYAEKDARVKVIHKTNGGLVSARKAGLRIAEGGYVGFVDGDDFIEAQFYERLLQDMLEHQVDFVHTGYTKEQNGIGLRCFNFETEKYTLTKEVAVNFIENGILNSQNMHVYHGMVNNLFRKEFIQKCYDRVPDEQSIGEDLICFCICLLEGSGLYMHKLALYHYIQRSGSIINTVNTERIIQLSKLQICLKNIFTEYKVYDSLQKCFEQWFLKEIITTLKKTVRGGFISLYYFTHPEWIHRKKVVIYGAGDVGQDYYLQLSRNLDCRIVCWVDANYHAYHFEYGEVKEIGQLKKLQYDIILIAVKSPEHAGEIKEELVADLNIPETSIIWERPGYICAE